MSVYSLKIIIVKPSWILAILQTKNAFGLEKRFVGKGRPLLPYWWNHVCFTPLVKNNIYLFISYRLLCNSLQQPILTTALVHSYN